MKKLSFFGLSILMALTLVSCGNNQSQSNDASQPSSSKSDNSKPSVTSGGNVWPEADFIPKEAKYTGEGDIVYTQFVDGKEEGNVDQRWTVFYKGAKISDVKNYIETLKNNGFKYVGEEAEREAEFKDEMYDWIGSTEDNSRGIILYISEKNDTYVTEDNDTEISYNMYIQFSNYNPELLLKNEEN